MYITTWCRSDQNMSYDRTPINSFSLIFKMLAESHFEFPLFIPHMAVTFGEGQVIAMLLNLFIAIRLIPV